MVWDSEEPQGLCVKDTQKMIALLPVRQKWFMVMRMMVIILILHSTKQYID